MLPVFVVLISVSVVGLFYARRFAFIKTTAQLAHRSCKSYGIQPKHVQSPLPRHGVLFMLMIEIAGFNEKNCPTIYARDYTQATK